MSVQMPEATHDLATSRIAVYRFVSTALACPTPEQHAWLTGSEFRQSLELACAFFGFACPEGELFPAEYADHESRHLACFEVGVPAAPVPLLASHYNTREPAPRVIHEHILFFRRFGMTPPAGNAEPADHLLHELAFLIRLDELLMGGELERASVLLGRRDFLKRQVTRWPASAATAAEEKHLPPVYCALLAVLAAAVRQDLELTVSAVSALDQEKP